MIPFGEWRPDIAAWNGQFGQEAKGVLPMADGYRPIPGLDTVGAAVPARVRGAFTAYTRSRNPVFFCGTADKLYRFNTASQSWDDVSKAGGYTLPVDDEWSFVQFGDYVLAAHQNDVLQQFNIETDSVFSDVSGSPQARIVAVVADFVVCGDLNSAPRTVQWSDLEDHTTWTTGGTSLADSQVMPDFGNVTGVIGGESGLVFQERGIRRMTFAPGSDFAFFFDVLSRGTGCRSPFAIANKGLATFFLADDGIYMMSGEGVVPIGAQRVNQWFFGRLDPVRLWRTKFEIDQSSTRLFIAFPSAAAEEGLHDTILVYDWSVDRFTWIETKCCTLVNAALVGVSIDDMDALFASLEAITPSLDSRVWQGGAPVMGLFNDENKLAFFADEANNFEATMDTPEVQLAAPNRAFVNRLHPACDTSQLVARVGTRERVADSVTWRPEASMAASGRVSVRAGGRFHRFRVRVPAGVLWTRATGVGAEIDGQGAR